MKVKLPSLDHDYSSIGETRRWIASGGYNKVNGPRVDDPKQNANNAAPNDLNQSTRGPLTLL